MMALLSLAIGLILGAIFGFAFGRCSSRNDEERDKGKRRRNDSCASQDPHTILEIERRMTQEGIHFARQVTGGSPPKSPTALSEFRGNGRLRDGDTSVSSYSSDGDVGTVYGLGGYSQSSRVLLCMVGLPARGKSYITKMLMRYLTWSGFPVKSFNAGNMRRQGGNAGASASFFGSSQEATKRREAIADACMMEAIEWLRLHKSVCVAIFDATNTTIRRRQRIIDKCRMVTGITAVFVESICDNKDILERNYALKLANDDYRNMDPAKARADFENRVKEYEARYQSVVDQEDGGEICYVKLFNVGQKVEMHHCSGYLMSQIGFFLSNIHISPRCIWLTRHAESEDQLSGILGSHRGELTKNGRNYCRELSTFLRKRRREMEEGGQAETSGDILVLMGTAPVHYSTLQSMMMRGSSPNLAGDLNGDFTPGNTVHCKGFQAMSTSLLNELDGGVCNGLSYAEIQSDYPDLWAARDRDKLNFRYPNGESYKDVIGRLRPIIIELERQRRSILVISHLAVQRCLYAYFTGKPMEEIPYLEMDMHEVVELRPGAFDCEVQKVKLWDTSPDCPTPLK
mmetsp:Transcript_45959/g.103163  ORF Transcript_45959/g.103163 Transcript_45959/m.103163 type:complete len:571 (+) Transcript_45959:92-1804(+)